MAKQTLDFLVDFQTKSHQGYLTIAPKKEERKPIKPIEETKEQSETKGKMIKNILQFLNLSKFLIVKR